MLLSLAGGLLGFVLGMFAALQFPDAPLAALYPFLAAGLGWAFSYAVIAAVSGGAGGLFSRIYSPGGRTGSRREYSLAESFVARGRYEDAVSAFELAVAEHPDDPTPYLRIARICRDHLDDPQRSARWFRRARDESSMSDERRRIVTRELIELYERSGERVRAAPELARLAETYPETREGVWAKAELAELKKLIAGGDDENVGPSGRREP
jgi:tetratricopeptide (TPR) repeat protein